MIVFISSSPISIILSLYSCYSSDEKEKIYSVISGGTISKFERGKNTPYKSIKFPGKPMSQRGRYKTIYREFIRLQINDIPINKNTFNVITMK